MVGGDGRCGKKNEELGVKNKNGKLENDIVVGRYIFMMNFYSKQGNSAGK